VSLFDTRARCPINILFVSDAWNKGISRALIKRRIACLIRPQKEDGAGNKRKDNHTGELKELHEFAPWFWIFVLLLYRRVMTFGPGALSLLKSLPPITDVKIGKVFHGFPQILFRGITVLNPPELAQSHLAFRLGG